MYRLRIRRPQAVYGVLDMTKKTLAMALVASIASVPMFSTLAAAADLTYSEPAPYNEPALATSNNWDGAYVGGHLGTASRKLNPFDGGKGVAAGIQGGYNADVGGVVVGGEGELSYLGDADVRVNGGNLKERHRLGLKAKAGVPLGQTLIYGTAGLAMTNFRDNGGVSGPDGWKGGYIVGAGIEQKLTDKISAKVEYNYTGTPNVRSFANGVGSETDVHDHTIKAGVNYKF
jgi:outer membrane immunogenic protein